MANPYGAIERALTRTGVTLSDIMKDYAANKIRDIQATTELKKLEYANRRLDLQNQVQLAKVGIEREKTLADVRKGETQLGYEGRRVETAEEQQRAQEQYQKGSLDIQRGQLGLQQRAADMQEQLNAHRLRVDTLGGHIDKSGETQTVKDLWKKQVGEGSLKEKMTGEEFWGVRVPQWEKYKPNAIFRNYSHAMDEVKALAEQMGKTSDPKELDALMERARPLERTMNNLRAVSSRNPVTPKEVADWVESYKDMVTAMEKAGQPIPQWMVDQTNPQVAAETIRQERGEFASLGQPLTMGDVVKQRRSQLEVSGKQAAGIWNDQPVKTKEGYDAAIARVRELYGDLGVQGFKAMAKGPDAKAEAKTEQQGKKAEAEEKPTAATREPTMMGPAGVVQEPGKTDILSEWERGIEERAKAKQKRLEKKFPQLRSIR